jgi:hypothetical protein
MKNFADQDALHRIIARAARDVDFRERLLRDPRAAIREVTGVPVPDDLRIRFIEKDRDVDVMIVLPGLASEEGELTEEDVADVTGGGEWSDGSEPGDGSES